MHARLLGLSAMFVGVFGAFHCAPTTPRAVNTADPLATPAEPGDGVAPPDAGALSACTHDARDLAPCSAECDRGIATGCTTLALRIERGDGIPKDLTRAVMLHERACELRDAAACVSAARMH